MFSDYSHAASFSYITTVARYTGCRGEFSDNTLWPALEALDLFFLFFLKKTLTYMNVNIMIINKGIFMFTFLF